MKTCRSPVWSARTLDEALALRAEHPDATVIAGGTDVMVQLEAGQIEPTGLIDLWGCEGFGGIDIRDGALRVSALTTWTELVEHPDMPETLQDCGRTIGAMQNQNRGTIGGNIVNASPAGDSLPLWLAADAEFEVASIAGRRRVPASQFWTGYRQTAMAPDEILVAVHVAPLRAADGTPDSWYYRKVGTRLAQAISKVVLGGRLRVEGGVVTLARVALGSVAPVPIRLIPVEQALVGRPVDPGAAELVSLTIRPIDDMRSTAIYRSQVARNIVRTWLRAERRLAHGG